MELPPSGPLTGLRMLTRRDVGRPKTVRKRLPRWAVSPTFIIELPRARAECAKSGYQRLTWGIERSDYGVNPARDPVA